MYLRCVQAAVLKQYRCVFAMFELTRCVFAMLGPLCLKLPPEPNNCQKTQNPRAPAAIPPRGPCVVPRCRAYHETHLQIESTRLLKFSDVLLFCLSLLNSPYGVLRFLKPPYSYRSFALGSVATLSCVVFFNAGLSLLNVSESFKGFVV